MKRAQSSTLLLVGLGIGGVLLYKRNQDAKRAALAAAMAAAQPKPNGFIPGMNGLGDVLLTAPDGQTVSSSGQVLGWLGDGYETNDVYDAAPRQYMHKVINDLAPFNGLGKFSVSSITRPVSNLIQQAAPIAQFVAPVISPVAAIAAAMPVAQQLTQHVPVLNTLTKLGAGAANFADAGNALKAPVMVLQSVPGLSKPPPPPASPSALQAASAAGIGKAEDWLGHTIWVWNTPNGTTSPDTKYIIDYDANANTFAAGPYPTQYAARDAVQQLIWVADWNAVGAGQNYNGHNIMTAPAAGGGVVYIVDPAQPGNPPTSGPKSGSGWATNYATMEAAKAAIDAAAPADQKYIPSAPAQGYVVNFAQDYNGHTVSVTGQAPGGPPVYVQYLVDYGTDHQASQGFPTMAEAKAWIDARAPHTPENLTLTTPQGPNSLPSNGPASTVTFAQAYGGHTISVTSTTPVMYLVDYVPGANAASFSTMADAKAAIDAANGPSSIIPPVQTTAPSSSPYASSDYGTSTAPASGGAYSYDQNSGVTPGDGSTGPVYVPQDAPVTKSGNGTVGVIAAGALAAAGAYFLSK